MDFVKQLELLTASETEEERKQAEFYILKPNFFLRAWQDIPFAVFDQNKASVIPTTELENSAVQICNGRVDIHCFAVTPSLRRAVLNLVDRGIVEKCAYGTAMEQRQLMHRFDTPLRPTAKWAITGRCNMKCKHCFLSAPDAKFGEMSHEECMRLIDQMAEMGISRVGLTGGEPLVRPDFFQLVDALIAKGIDVVGIATNGLLVNERFADELESRNLHPRIFMSYDGTEGWHDWLRGIDGAERVLMKKFELLAKRGFYTGSAMTIHKLNKGVIRDSVNRLASVGVRHVIVNRMTNFGEWEKYGTDFNISAEELYAAFFEYLPQFYADGAPVQLVLNRFFQTMDQTGKDYRIIPAKGYKKCSDYLCLPTHNVVYITADGKVMPCLYVASQETPCVQMPNVKNGLREAMTDPRYLGTVDIRVDEYFDHNPACRACKYSNLCMGGCRAHALETNPNDYLSKDYENCMFYHNDYHTRIYELMKQIAPDARCINFSPEHCKY